jgi:hypothetical protein
MYKFPAERVAWMDSQKDSIEVTPVQVLKCFVKDCNVQNKHLDDEKHTGWCVECNTGGMKLWFCADHEVHDETQSCTSHNLMIGRQMTVSEMLRSNEYLSDELGLAFEGELSYIVCICDHEKWHAGDIFGTSFTSFHNRQKIHRHFDARTAISWDKYPTNDKINGDILINFSMIID